MERRYTRGEWPSGERARYREIRRERETETWTHFTHARHTTRPAMAIMCISKTDICLQKREKMNERWCCPLCMGNLLSYSCLLHTTVIELVAPCINQSFHWIYGFLFSCCSVTRLCYYFTFSRHCCDLSSNRFNSKFLIALVRFWKLQKLPASTTTCSANKCSLWRIFSTPNSIDLDWNSMIYVRCTSMYSFHLA